VLKTNTELSAEAVALKYKELRQVEHTFRDLKSTFETGPVFHKRDETIRGHVFCSFLALALRKMLQRKLEEAGHGFSRAQIKQDLEALQVTMIDENGKRLAVPAANPRGPAGKSSRLSELPFDPPSKNFDPFKKRSR